MTRADTARVVASVMHVLMLRNWSTIPLVHLPMCQIRGALIAKLGISCPIDSSSPHPTRAGNVHTSADFMETILLDAKASIHMFVQRKIVHNRNILCVASRILLLPGRFLCAICYSMTHACSSMNVSRFPSKRVYVWFVVTIPAWVPPSQVDLKGAAQDGRAGAGDAYTHR